MKIILTILLLVWSVLSYAASPVVSCSVSRNTGVAPLSVFIDCTGTTDADTTRPFHDLHYEHSFGDLKRVNWAYGANVSASKNFAVGPVAAHVYETSGTYTITTRITDGTTTLTVTNSIVVTNPDTYYSGTNTICIASITTPIAGSDGCPAGAAVYTQASFSTAINTYKATGKRILFKHDDTFTCAAAATINVTGPATIGMYGTGARPIILLNATSGITLGSPTVTTMQDWRIMDLDIDGQASTANIPITANGNADQITMLRLYLHSAAAGISLSGSLLEYYATPANGGYSMHMFDQITIADSVLFSFTTNNGIFLWANHLAILGNSVDNNATGQHAVRIAHSAKGVISHNTFAYPALTKQAFTLRAVAYTSEGCPTGECMPIILPYGTYAALTSQTIVSNNKFIGGVSDQPVTVVPANPAVWDQRFQDIILERNWYTGAGTQCCWAMLGLTSQDVTVRNEVMNLTGAGEHRGVQVNSAGTASPAAENVNLYNNTIFSNDATNFTAFRVSNGAINIKVVNNLAYSPNVSGSFFGSGFDYAAVKTNNTTTTNTSPALAVVPPSILADFRIGTTSYALNGGTSLYSATAHDFFNCADKNGNIRMGALVPKAYALCVSGYK